MHEKNFFLMLCPIIFSVTIINFIYIFSYADTYAMNPTIREKDLVVFKRSNTKINRYDIVLIQKNSRRSIVRVIGLPYESILYNNDTLYIDGKKKEESFIQHEKDNSQSYGGLYTENFSLQSISGDSTIPENQFLVLYDNRFMDNDSRSYGLINKEEILGIYVGLF